MEISPSASCLMEIFTYNKMFVWQCETLHLCPTVLIVTKCILASQWFVFYRSLCRALHHHWGHVYASLCSIHLALWERYYSFKRLWLSPTKQQHFSTHPPVANGNTTWTTMGHSQSTEHRKRLGHRWVVKPWYWGAIKPQCTGFQRAHRFI